MASVINERVVIIPSLQQSLIDSVLISSIPIYKYKDLVVTTMWLGWDPHMRSAELRRITKILRQSHGLLPLCLHTSQNTEGAW
jgi:hypothetical protein